MGLWKMGKYIGTHNCEMDTFNRNHFNLDVDLISLQLVPHIEAVITYKIKKCITSIHQEYRCTITKRKAYLGRKRAFEIVYGDWDKSFASLPKYMAALKHFNPGTVVEWKLEQSAGRPEYIFRYVFWAFKPAINGFVHCHLVIFIDGTHVYENFAICANESEKAWMLFLNHLKQHVVKQRSGICLVSDQHDSILSSIEHLLEWKESYAYQRYCVRHMKANFKKKYPNKDLHYLMRMAVTDH
ncbi:uncharacterized protein [Nicotiana sylvestris]|uniref:uncharacterized protein n=1 Tax=Nicotiana sylvestris TaxID=4096 RepID=UPI00388C7FB2